MYGIVATDLDETLIGWDHAVHPGNLEAARLMREAGVRLVVATGRPFYSTRSTLELLGTWGDPAQCTITLNGGFVCANDGAPIYSHALSRAQAEAIFAYGMALGICIHVYVPGRTYSVNLTQDEVGYLAGRLETEPLPGGTLDGIDEPIFKVLYNSADFAWLQRIKKDMERDLPRLMAGLAVSFSANRYLEMNPAGVDKGKGLAAVAAHYGVPMEATIALGDSLNDLPMLKAAGLGLVVSNVSETIAAEAPHVLRSSCADPALLEVWERYVRPSLGSASQLP